MTRYGKGTVVVVGPEVERLREIELLGSRPSNICFGGSDGKTVCVTEVEHGRLVRFRAEHPGRIPRFSEPTTRADWIHKIPRLGETLDDSNNEETPHASRNPLHVKPLSL